MSRPAHWVWSHDIKPDQIDGLPFPGWGLVSLSSYGHGDRRRFAAVMHHGRGVGRTSLLDLDPAEIEPRLRHAGARPVAITADSAPRPRLSMLVEDGPGPWSRAVADLDEDEVRALLGEPAGIADITTYVVGGMRRHAVVLDRSAGPSLLFTGVTARQLRRELRRSRAKVVRLRAYVQDGQQLLTAVAQRTTRGFCAWYADLSADGVARKLDRHRAYPVDLGAIRDERGVRYTVVMRR